MSTFDGIVEEFPDIRIDNFVSSKVKAPLACFLSHVHTDHTQGLETYRSAAFIYCSAATKALLLHMEKYPSRVNYDNGYLEARVFHFRHLASTLRPLPLNTPCEVKLTPQKRIRVTLIDANHCPGAVMFLIEGGGKTILYTGDIRAEQWWVDALMRNPAMVAYVAGVETVDKVYLDTTYATSDTAYRTFPSKSAGTRSLIRQIRKYPSETVFHIKSWTLGYEEVLMAIAAAFRTKINVDRYKLELYRSLEPTKPDTVSSAESASLNGFWIGAFRHDGILSLGESRFHICDPECQELKKYRKRAASNLVRVIPIVGGRVQEIGAPVRLLPNGQSESLELAPNQIIYPYARHSSYEELRGLVKALRPRDVHPCVFDHSEWHASHGMEAVFGDLCSEKTFAFDKRQKGRLVERADTPTPPAETQELQGTQLAPSSPTSAHSVAPRNGKRLVLEPISSPPRVAKRPRAAPASLAQEMEAPPSSGEGASDDRPALEPLKAAFEAAEGLPNYYPDIDSQAASHRLLPDGQIMERENTRRDEYTIQVVVPLASRAPTESQTSNLDSQITLPDSEFASQSSVIGPTQRAARQAAYRAARDDVDGRGWAELSRLAGLRTSRVVEDIEL